MLAERRHDAPGVTDRISRALSNSHQALDVYFHLADLGKYARSRLFIRLFMESNYRVADLERYLSRYDVEAASRIVRGRQPDDPAKWSAFPKRLRDGLAGPLSKTARNNTKKNRQLRRNDKRRTISRERQREQARTEAAKSEA